MIQVRLPVYQEEDPLYISSFGIERVGMDARWGPGRRTEGIIHYVLSGRGFYNGNPVHENQGFYIAPNSFCEYMPDPEEPWNYFWMDCSPQFADHYVKQVAKPDEKGIFSYDFRGLLSGYIEKIMSATHTMSVVEALGFGFSILALHTPQESASRGIQYVRRAKNYIESSIGRRLSVRDVAEAVSIHDRYLYTLFVQIEGISPKEYILLRKMETAKDLLANTDLTVSDIAQATGLPDVYSFSRLFKAKQGVSPSAYRKAIEFHRFGG